MLERDETIREGATLEAMAKLEPSFAMIGQMGFDATALRKYTTVERITHMHHAGNSSGIVDGAALMLLGNQEGGAKAGLKPRARVKAVAVIGSEPTIMLTGPTPACKKALAKAGMAAKDIDLWEVNEAFAVVPMKTARDLGVSLDRVPPASPDRRSRHRTAFRFRCSSRRVCSRVPSSPPRRGPGA